MARRKELGSIASGISGSFNSRNNDVDGYWGIGKLYKFLEKEDEKVIELDLLEQCIRPPTSEFHSMLALYLAKLESLLGKRCIPRNWVMSAKIIVSFEVDFEHKHHYWRCALGKPCEVKCEIIDDNGRHHITYAYNNCRPHDSSRESKSCRTGNF
ncbi:hypothetical protein [Agarivorans sp. QJM3NY_25]|uniref:hypothetical protein n=1 Tax=Agarivorans sp. QJM3NY_25 TaxID=3421430 RepID=UPI003D7D1540